MRERDGLWARVGGAGFLTDAEKSQALGLGAADAARTLADVEVDAGVAGKGAAGEVKYGPDQPRDDHGRWTSEGGDGDGTSGSRLFAGDVIRVCIIQGVGRSHDSYGNPTYTATYECSGGRTLQRSGPGHSPRGIIRDPFQ